MKTMAATASPSFAVQNPWSYVQGNSNNRLIVAIRESQPVAEWPDFEWHRGKSWKQGERMLQGPDDALAFLLISVDIGQR